MGWGLEIGYEKLWWASATWPGELEGKHMTTAGEKEEVSIQSWLWTRLFSNAVQLWSVTELQRSRERNRNEMLGQCRYTASSSSTARDKIGTATEQRNSPFGTSAHNKTQKAPRSKAASRALCNRNFEMETGCLMNCKMLSLMREAIRSAVLLSASSFFPSQACHRHGNLDRTNREHTIPGTQQLFDRACSWVCTGVCKKHQREVIIASLSPAASAGWEHTQRAIALLDVFIVTSAGPLAAIWVSSETQQHLLIYWLYSLGSYELWDNVLKYSWAREGINSCHFKV